MARRLGPGAASPSILIAGSRSEALDQPRWGLGFVLILLAGGLERRDVKGTVQHFPQSWVPCPAPPGPGVTIGRQKGPWLFKLYAHPSPNDAALMLR